MSDLFLAPSELQSLTGFKARHCQVRWLDKHRWRYALTRNGEPKVARDHFRERMGCGRASMHADAVNQAAAAAAPNFAALDRRR
jgi:hypothetical protein